MQEVKNCAVIIADCGCSQRSAPSFCRPQAELSAPSFGIYKNSVTLKTEGYTVSSHSGPNSKDSLSMTRNLYSRSMKYILE